MVATNLPGAPAILLLHSENRFMRFTLTLCLTAILGSLSAQRAPIEFEEYDLKNGLHVILHEDHSAPIVAVSVMYHVGSKNEDPNRTASMGMLIRSTVATPIGPGPACARR